MQTQETKTEDPYYIRALKLQKELNNKYQVKFIVEFIKEWEAITALIRRCGK